MENSLDLSGAAFWLALGAVIVASILSGWLRERELQRTIRASIEKFGHIDPALARLVEEREKTERLNNAMWSSGSDHRVLRKLAAVAVGFVFGIVSLVTFLGFGIGLMVRMAGPPPYDEAGPLLILLPGLGAALVVAVAGSLICRAIWGKTPKPPPAPEPIA